MNTDILLPGEGTQNVLSHLVYTKTVVPTAHQIVFNFPRVNWSLFNLFILFHFIYYHSIQAWVCIYVKAFLKSCINYQTKLAIGGISKFCTTFKLIINTYYNTVWHYTTKMILLYLKDIILDKFKFFFLALRSEHVLTDNQLPATC